MRYHVGEGSSEVNPIISQEKPTQKSSTTVPQYFSAISCASYKSLSEIKASFLIVPALTVTNRAQNKVVVLHHG
jgi:hypothetical protein